MEPLGLLTRPVVWRTRGRKRVSRLPTKSTGELWHLGRVLRRLSALAGEVDPDAPWQNARGRALDKMSFRELLDRLGARGEPRDLLSATLGTLATVSTDEISALHVPWWIAGAEGLLASVLGAVQYRFTHGAQSLADSIVSKLQGPVLLGNPVSGITQDEHRVSVETQGGEAWEGRYVIVACPLTKVSQIDFDPPLSPDLQAMHGELAFGRLTKIVGVTDQPPDNRAGLSIGGELITVGWRRGRTITGFAYGTSAERSEEALFADLGVAFGVDDWTYRRVCRWHEQPNILGSYLAPGPDQLVRHGPQLARPYRRVLFAGDARSRMPDTIEGAVQSAEDVAWRIRVRHVGARSNLLK